MKNTLRNCLIAQNCSDAAKQIRVDEGELHYEEIAEIIDTYDDWREIRDNLYGEKGWYIREAITSAIEENIDFTYDIEEGCIYFEFPFGQVSFHVSESWIKSSKEYEKIKIVDNYQWSGLHNSRDLLISNFY